MANQVITQEQVKKALTFGNKKSLTAQFNSRNKKVGGALQFGVEVAHLEKCIGKNKSLVHCTQESLGNTLLEAAAIGVSLHPKLQHAYPIPYKNSATSKYECELQIGYQGMEHVALIGGTVQSIQAAIVYKNDTFKVWTDETGRHFSHEEARSNRGDITHAYCLARYMNGGHHLEVMDYQEILKCEKAAVSREGGGKAWKGDFRDQMILKCPTRRGWKHWPKDIHGQMAAAMDAMDKLDPMDFKEQKPIEKKEDDSGITITDDDALSLHALLVDHGLDSKTADRWLEKMAGKMGLGDIKNLPHSQLKKAKSDLKEYIELWKNK